MSYEEYDRYEDELVYDEGDYDKDEYDDEENLDEYKTPTDEDFDALGKAAESDDFVPEEDYRIDTGAEWRDFSDGGPTKSRVGMARAADIDEDLGTLIVDEKFKKLERMSRTPEDIFRAIAMDTATKYGLGKDVYEDSLRVMQLINKHNKRVKYRNPRAIMFAILVFTNGKIDKKKLDKVYEDKAVHEKMTKIDLLRYAFFIRDLRKL